MRAPLTALGDGLLWPLFDEGHLRLLFVDRLPSAEEWPAFVHANPQTTRTRRPGEEHPEAV